MTAITDYPFALIPSAVRCRELSTAPTDALRVLARHLDLPMEDAESIDFLRQALKATSVDLQLAQAHYRMERLKEQQP